ncbi:MAG: BMP family protein [Planctomycetes bacterium]|nr:BMP family protein [Planctomycetota bacterium]
MLRTFLLLTLFCCAYTAEPLKIGLICSGSVTDGGWNQLAKEAIEQVKKELKAEVSILQKVTQDKAGDELRAYAADGYDLVIAHGYEFLTPAAEVAAGTTMKIAVSGADVARPGIVTLDFDVSQASYQLGVIAGTLTKSGKLGFVGGAPIPSVKACYRGFLAGARAVRPDVSVAEAYTSWDEPVKSKQQTEAFFAQGIDLVYHDVDAASRGVFEAVKERNARNPAKPVYVFGCVADQNANPICPDHILASAVIRLDATFRAVAESVVAKTFAAGVVRENLQRGTCVAVLNPRLIGTILTPEILAGVERAGKQLVAGSLIIPGE